MKLIVLYGPENSGKTTTLEIVYERLKRISIPRATNMFWSLDGIQRDFIDVLDIDKTRLGKEGYNSPEHDYKANPEVVSVGIVTQGDYVTGTKTIRIHLDRKLQEKCDIVVCACSDKGNKETNPIDQICEFVTNNNDKVFKEPNICIKNQSEEKDKADEIMQKIGELCNNNN